MKSLTDYTSEKQTELFNRLGAFFAFSTKQFEEAHDPKVKKYVNCGAGLICPKHHVEELLTELEAIHSAGIKQDIEENGPAAILEREYFNYETQLTCNTEPVKDALSDYFEQYPELFTPELIELTFKRCFKLAQKNNWF